MSFLFGEGGPIRDFLNSGSRQKENPEYIKFILSGIGCDRHGYSQIHIEEMYYDMVLDMVIAYWLCPNCGEISKEVFK